MTAYFIHPWPTPSTLVTILDRKRNEIRNYFQNTTAPSPGAMPFQPTEISTETMGGNKAGLKSHPDTNQGAINQNTAIPWCESIVGKAITRLKGLGASIDMKSNYDA